MKTAIVYYSLNGNTAFTAELIAKKLGAELIRIKPEKAYPSKGLMKFFHGGKSAIKNETPKLKPYSFDAEKYERIIFGSPVWASNIAPPLRTFIEENKASISGKRFAAFVCLSGSGATKAMDKLKHCLGADTLEAELALVDPKDKPQSANDKRIADFCDALIGC
ncbi:MAG: NAD(P)H-dependent oxidoreductase [Clostridia bacterium]|nr:NAD(P)H-dependent oxidoreductase [Clostridia bacterium]